MHYSIFFIFTVLASTVYAQATDTVRLYVAKSCARMNGDEECPNIPAGECCSTDELSPIEYFFSTRAQSGNNVIFAFSNQGDRRCVAGIGSGRGCVSLDEKIIAGAFWRPPQQRADNLLPTMATGNENSAAQAATSSSETSAAGNHSAPACRHHVTDTVLGYAGRKQCKVKKSDFNRAYFEALPTEEEKTRYIFERAHTIEDDPEWIESQIPALLTGARTYYIGYGEGKQYWVKTSAFNKTDYEALETEEEKTRFFKERAAIVKDNKHNGPFQIDLIDGI